MLIKKIETMFPLVNYEVHRVNHKYFLFGNGNLIAVRSESREIDAILNERIGK